MIYFLKVLMPAILLTLLCLPDLTYHGSIERNFKVCSEASHILGLSGATLPMAASFHENTELRFKGSEDFGSSLPTSFNFYVGFFAVPYQLSDFGDSFVDIGNCPRWLLLRRILT
jgi:hypothetical protein